MDTAQLRPEETKELVKPLAEAMTSPNYNSRPHEDPINIFVDVCIKQQLQQTVENNWSSLADKELSPEDLALMREIKLNNKKVEGEKEPEFRIGIPGSNKFVSFSNRFSNTNLELRGNKLRTLLDDLKNTNPSISLYDALTKLVKDPELMVAAFYNTISSTINPGHISETSAISLLTKVAKAGINYILENNSKGISEEESIKMLKKVLHEKNQDVFSLALTDNTAANALSQFFQTQAPLSKETEIKNAGLEEANKWLKEIRALASQHPEINPVVDAARNLIDWYNSPNPDQTTGQELTKAFTNEINSAQKLHLEKLSWKNVFNVFLFIPSIAKLIKTGGQSFWLKSHDNKASELLLKKPKILEPALPKEQPAESPRQLGL